MYAYVDRPVTGLDNGGRFLVLAMRSWIGAMQLRSCPADALGPAFAKWNMLHGLQPFLRTMACFNRHALETFHFCRLCCNHISEHEAIILGLVGALHDGDPMRVGATLDLLIEPECHGELMGALCTLGRAMQGAGLRLAEPAALPRG